MLYNLMVMSSSDYTVEECNQILIENNLPPLTIKKILAFKLEFLYVQISQFRNLLRQLVRTLNLLLTTNQENILY